MRLVHQHLPVHGCVGGEEIILARCNEQGHRSADIYVYYAATRKWNFVRAATTQEIVDTADAESKLPGVAAVVGCVLPFSWVHTKKVCQRWQAAFAAMHGQNPNNVC